MSGTLTATPSFSVAHGSAPSDVLVAGFSSFGFAGLIAVGYVVDDLGIDSEPLASFAAEVRRHYGGLAERFEEHEPDGADDRIHM